MTSINQLVKVLENTDKSSTELILDVLEEIKRLISKNLTESDIESLLKDIITLLCEKRNDLVIFSYIGTKIEEIVTENSQNDTKLTIKAIYEFFDQLRVINDETVDHASIYLQKQQKIERIITVSYSRLVFNVIKKGSFKTVYVCESRPKNEGIRFAQDLLDETKGVEVVLLPDALGPKTLIEKADAVLLGMDAWFLDNSISNKTGSLSLALTAKYIHKPVLVIGNVLKKVNYPPENYNQQNFAEELKKTYPALHGNVSYLNEYFDVVPSNLITKILE